MMVLTSAMFFKITRQPLFYHFSNITLLLKFSISKEWQQFAEESQQPVDTNVTAIKDITQIFQEKIKQEKQTCTTETISLNVFLNNVVCIYWVCECVGDTITPEIYIN